LYGKFLVNYVTLFIASTSLIPTRNISRLELYDHPKYFRKNKDNLTQIKRMNILRRSRSQNSSE